MAPQGSVQGRSKPIFSISGISSEFSAMAKKGEWQAEDDFPPARLLTKLHPCPKYLSLHHHHPSHYLSRSESFALNPWKAQKAFVKFFAWIFRRCPRLPETHLLAACWGLLLHSFMLAGSNTLKFSCISHRPRLTSLVRVEFPLFPSRELRVLVPGLFIGSITFYFSKCAIYHTTHEAPLNSSCQYFRLTLLIPVYTFLYLFLLLNTYALSTNAPLPRLPPNYSFSELHSLPQAQYLKMFLTTHISLR